MIIKMKKATVCTMRQDKDDLLNKLMQISCVQFDTAQSLHECEEIEKLCYYENVDMYQLETSIAKLSSAINALVPYKAKPSLFNLKPTIDFDELTDNSIIEQGLLLSNDIEELTKKSSELISLKAKHEFSIGTLQPWISSNIPLNLNETNYTTIKYLQIPSNIEIEELNLSVTALLCHFIIVNEDRDFKYLVAIIDKISLDLVISSLKSINITFPKIENSQFTPIMLVEQYKNYINQINEELCQIDNELKAFAVNISILQLAYDSVLLQLDNAKQRKNLINTQYTCLFNAWIPDYQISNFEKVLQEFKCFYVLKDPSSDEDFPVLLKNNKLIEPFESVTEMYSLPSPQGLDPDPFIAPFYFLFFGMMLSDAGYGIILILFSLFALKKLQLGASAKKLVKLIGYCGVSTVIWGAIYGGWFGNVFSIISETFFNKSFTMPALIDPLQEPMTILILSFVLGAVHLFVGMGLKAYLLIKRGHLIDAIFDVGFWYLVLLGLPMLVLGGVFSTIGTYMSIIGAIGLVLTQGRSKPNIFGKITSGILSLYDITGYFSDVLSYSRILALGLCTGVIANVVNTLAALPGANILGTLVFIIVFILGHILNIAINALGSYVHTSRLQYVEFFGKFYESGGKPFIPFKANTKYHLVADKY